MSQLELPQPSVRVVNVRSGATYDVAIGRPSKWGNPFTHLERSLGIVVVHTRAEAVACHDDWLLGRYVPQPHHRVRGELPPPPPIDQIRAELRGRVLGCHCAPLACHGHALARIANQED